MLIKLPRTEGQVGHRDGERTGGRAGLGRHRLAGHEGNVRRLRRRIFKATREQDWAQVRSLQKMMLRSWSNTLVSVRQVAQRNAGRKTAGIDGQVALSSRDRAEMAVRVHRTISTWDRCRSGARMYRRPTDPPRVMSVRPHVGASFIAGRWPAASSCGASCGERFSPCAQKLQQRRRFRASKVLDGVGYLDAGPGA